MQRSNIFLVILIVSLVSIVVMFFVAIYALSASSLNPTDWMYYGGMGGRMGGMMGGTGSALSYVGVLVLVLVVVAIIGIGGLVYFIMFPEIRGVTPIKQDENVPSPSIDSQNNSYSAVYKTLKPEEKKVLDVLATNDGKYLQKYLRKDAGLSRLKVHRILSRLAERGMVTLQKSGNTNVVILADWLKPK